MVLLANAKFNATVGVTTTNRHRTGMSQMATTGSITAGSDQLPVASVMDFRVGDWVIVATGGESGAGARGTKGVGGFWPTLTYADATAMNADTSQADTTPCWLETTKDVWYWDDAGNAWVQSNAVSYYYNKLLPKALWAQITNIAGSVLTLSKTATVSTTNAGVYFDNWGIVQDLVNSQEVIDLPEGTYYMSDAVFISRFILGEGARRTFRGAGQTKTILKTPSGASHGGVEVYDLDGVVLQDYEVDCGARNVGFGLRWENHRANGAEGYGTRAGQTYPPNVRALGAGNLFEYCNNGVARNITSRNAIANAAAASYCADTWFYNCKAVIVDPFQVYTQWQFILSDGSGGGYVDCEIDSNYYCAGFECFKHTSGRLLRLTSRNGAVGGNTTEGVLYEYVTVTFEDDRMSPSWTYTTPMMNFAKNTSAPVGDTPNVVKYLTLIQEGAANSSGQRLPGITQNAGMPPLELHGTYLTDFDNPKGLIHFQQGWDGVTSTGQMVEANTENITLIGMRLIGESSASPAKRAVIGINGAVVTITNCVLDNGVDGTSTPIESGNLTNAEYEAL